MQAKQFHTIYSLTTAYSNDIIKKMLEFEKYKILNKKAKMKIEEN